ncbi:MAG: amino acid ABC transporter substrate-binding protein [Spirochaetales bacterium]|nr:amino acid ABC transporter substrate-binding protein [Spirochaetales bacterium]
MTKFFPLLIFLLAFLSCNKKNELVVLTDHSFPPFEYLKDGEPAGVDPDIAVKIGERTGRKVKIISVGFSSIIPSIERKFGDIGIAAMTVTLERKKHVDFSIPYAKSEQFIISLNKFPVISRDEFDGIRIGIKQGTTGHSLVRQMDLKKTDLFIYPTTLHVVKALLNDEIDAIVIDQQTAAWAKSQYNQLQCNPLRGTAEYYAICIQKGNTKLLNEINAILEEMISTGEIEALIEKHSALF